MINNDKNIKVIKMGSWRKKKVRKEPTKQTKINVTAITPTVTASKPYTNFVYFDSTYIEEFIVLRKLLPNNGSYPYKDSLYELDDNFVPYTRYMEKYTTEQELPHLYTSITFDNENTYYIAIQDLIHSISSQYHGDSCINVRFRRIPREDIFKVRK